MAQTRVWVLTGTKLGDNTQLEMIAASLELDFSVKKLIPKAAFIRGKPRFAATLEHIDTGSADSLRPPWPELVVTTGRRHAMAALWIKQQSPRTRIVLLGRPRRWIEKFDLVIALPQYRVPPLDNVMHLDFPLMRADRQAVDNAGRTRAADLADRQRPLTAVLVGGPTQPYRFDAAVAQRLVSDCLSAAEGRAHTLYFATSPRTSTEVADALAAALPDGARLYRWRRDDRDNPYLGLLALADRCIVTGDSVSMMIEAADLGKPLAIYPLPTRLRGRLWQRLNQRLCRGRRHGSVPDPLYYLGRLLYRSGISGFPRDLGVIHDKLIAAGLARFLDDGFATPGAPLPSELPAIRERILDLL